MIFANSPAAGVHVVTLAVFIDNITIRSTNDAGEISGSFQSVFVLHM